MTQFRRVHWAAIAVIGCLLTLILGIALFIPKGAGGSNSADQTIAVVSASASSARPVLVHVVGAVRKPGLYDLPPESRIGDAVKAAGGLTAKADSASINLAGRAIDGTQVIVATKGKRATDSAKSAPTGGASGRGVSAETVSLNQATADDLQTLDKIGPALATRIIDYRTEHGGFTSVDQLLEVSGIGDKIFAGIKPRVTL